MESVPMLYPAWWDTTELSLARLASLIDGISEHRELLANCRAHVLARRVPLKVEAEIVSINFPTLRDEDLVAFLRGRDALAAAMSRMFPAGLDYWPEGRPFNPYRVKSWLFTNLLVFEAVSDVQSALHETHPSAIDRLLLHFMYALFFSGISVPAEAEMVRRSLNHDHVISFEVAKYRVLAASDAAEEEDLLKIMNTVIKRVPRQQSLREEFGLHTDELRDLLRSVANETITRRVPSDPYLALLHARDGRFNILPRSVRERAREALRQETGKDILRRCEKCGQEWDEGQKKGRTCPKCRATEVASTHVRPYSLTPSDSEKDPQTTAEEYMRLRPLDERGELDHSDILALRCLDERLRNKLASDHIGRRVLEAMDRTPTLFDRAEADEEIIAALLTAMPEVSRDALYRFRDRMGWIKHKNP